jgi:LPS-assembly protein
MHWGRVVGVVAMLLLLAPPGQAQQGSGNAVPPSLYLQADQLTYDTRGKRVIAQGNVEIYFNNYILTAEQVAYDEGTNRLVAEGNGQLKDPSGNITRFDRLEASDDFRDAFVRSLGTTAPDGTHRAPR